MKKVIFTTLLLLFLGTGWMLYLEYNNNRFIESLPSAPAATKQTVAPVLPPARDDTEIITTDAIVPESNPPHPHGETSVRADSVRAERAETSQVPVEEVPSLHSTEEPLIPSSEDKPIIITEISMDEMEKRITALDTLNGIVMNSENWVRGVPGADGFLFALPKAESEKIRNANRLLNPNTGSGIPPKRNAPVGNPRENPEAYEKIQFRGQTLYVPKR